jgi:hypothetical protein
VHVECQIKFTEGWKVSLQNLGRTWWEQY